MDCVETRGKGLVAEGSIKSEGSQYGQSPKSQQGLDQNLEAQNYVDKRTLRKHARGLSKGEIIKFVILKDPHDSSVENKSNGGKSKWKFWSRRE